MTSTLGLAAARAFRSHQKSPDVAAITFQVLRPQRSGQKWTCSDCRSAIRQQAFSKTTGRDSGPGIRQFTTSRILRDEPRKPIQDIPTSSQPTPTPNDSPIANHESLPSTTDRRRSQLTKRLTQITDSILARASIAGQHINAYTGTDYSGIEALRSRIAAQEEAVRSKISTVDSARTHHQEAHAEQGSAQKEIVGLLERKSSWSPTDLERYMSLVRSEHTNEQAVQLARDGLADAERDLESARSLLERLERKQYHEEQIWSDTIRRNSTWVTFGLMGVNIVLLLAQIAIFEPYRRRKIVKEVKKVMDESSVTAGTGAVVEEVERQIDDVVQPQAVNPEAIEESAPPEAVTGEPSMEDATLASQDVGEAPLAAGEVLPQEAADAPETSSIPPPLPPKRLDTWSALWESYVESFQDLFSERIVQLKKVDVTTTALQGAATGVAAMGLLFVVFRPR
ncbi:sensitivity to high expression protein she9 [Saxophila tyrrhenica]|uniref:Sensitive to high expression protein 9, mitochondrial n=1 Tax=Saxophila tyrrhenica TaxID=1690608 RepID=A0AAV9NYC4_9PEZI|nr:sensitivity to high expression protein she9 [Saxophila tyrrhenica]